MTASLPVCGHRLSASAVVHLPNRRPFAEAWQLLDGLPFCRLAALTG